MSNEDRERIEKDEHPLDSIKKVLVVIRAETIPIIGHSDPGALIDCWRLVDDYLNEIEKECSHFAANQCETPAGDEHGHFYCVRLRDALVEMKTNRGKNVMYQHELESLRSELSALREQLKQKDEQIKQLKQERNKAIDECIEVARKTGSNGMIYKQYLQNEFESLKRAAGVIDNQDLK